MRRAARIGRFVAATALGAAGLVMLASLLVTSGLPVVVALQAFSVVTVPLLLGAFVLLVVPLGGALRRAAVVPLTVAIAVGLVVGVARAVPFWTAGPARGDHALLRVATANLRLGSADPRQVMDLVHAEDPDLLVLEEITPALLRELDALGLRQALPYAAGWARPGAIGTMAFATSPLTAVERIASEHVSVSFVFRGLEVWGVHPAYPFSTHWSRDQAALARLGAERRPDLVLGDLNATLDNPPFRSFVRRAGLADAAEQAGSGWQPTWPVGGARGVPLSLAAIDHVLVGGRLDAVDTRTTTIADTDHKALVADLVVHRGP